MNTRLDNRVVLRIEEILRHPALLIPKPEHCPDGIRVGIGIDIFGRRGNERLNRALVVLQVSCHRNRGGHTWPGQIGVSRPHGRAANRPTTKITFIDAEKFGHLLRGIVTGAVQALGISEDGNPGQAQAAPEFGLVPPAFVAEVSLHRVSDALPLIERQIFFSLARHGFEPRRTDRKRAYAFFWLRQSVRVPTLTVVGQIRTVARTALNAWIAEDPNRRTNAAIARAANVSHVTVHGWRRGAFRPVPHHRDVIEIVTEGRARASDWLLPHERQGVASVRPFRALEKTRVHREKCAGRTGTTG